VSCFRLDRRGITCSSSASSGVCSSGTRRFVVRTENLTPVLEESREDTISAMLVLARRRAVLSWLPVLGVRARSLSGGPQGSTA
jgi:hypothetical protein